MGNDFFENWDIAKKQADVNMAIANERYERIVSGKEIPEDETEIVTAHEFLAIAYRDNPKKALKHLEKARTISYRFNKFDEYYRNDINRRIENLKQELRYNNNNQPWWKFW